MSDVRNLAQSAMNEGGVSSIRVLDLDDPQLAATVAGVKATEVTVERTTFVSLCVDMTGSMTPFTSSVVEEINNMLDALRKAGGAEGVLVQITAFNEGVGLKVIIPWTPILQVAALTLQDYTPDWMTPLWDATATTMGGLHLKAEEFLGEGKPVAGVFALLTDGRENASKRYSASDVAQLAADLVDLEVMVVLGFEFGPGAKGALEDMGLPLVIQTGMDHKNLREILHLVSSVSTTASMGTVSAGDLQQQAAKAVESGDFFA